MAPSTSIPIIAGTGRGFLRDALGSLVGQDFADWEAVVVEACVDPEDAVRVREQVAAVGDARVVLVPYDGPACPAYPPFASRRWNAGLRRARGEVVCFLDDDDMKAPGWLTAMCAPILLGQVDATVCRGSTINGDGARLGPAFGRPSLDLRSLVLLNFVTMGQVAVRRSVIEAVGGFDESLGCAEDWEMCLRLAGRPWREVDAESLKRDGVGNACYHPEVVGHTQAALRAIVKKYGLAPETCRGCEANLAGRGALVQALDGEGFYLWCGPHCVERYWKKRKGTPSC